MSLRFVNIRIDRLLGIRRGEGYMLENLSPGINLVHGPNGSGKTTTLQAIQEILWPGRTGLVRPTVSARLIVDNEPVDVDIDAGHPTCLSKGTMVPAPIAMAAESRNRYRMTLSELMKAEDREFARLIVTESQGGVDLAEAASALGFLAPGAAGRAESRTLLACRNAVREALQRQEALQQQADQLAGLRGQRDAAIQAQAEMETLRRALDHRAAAEACRDVEATRAAMPSVLERLHGDEGDRFRELDKQVEQAEQALRDARVQAQYAARELASANLPVEGVAIKTIPNLRSLQRAARERETALETRRAELTRATYAEEQVRNRLGAVVPLVQLGHLQALHVEPLNDFARRVNRMRARESVLEEQRRWLGARDQEVTGYPDEVTLQRGLIALQEWLAAPAAEVPVKTAGSWVGVVASATLGVLGLLLGILFHWAWGIILVPSLVLLWFDWKVRCGDSMPAAIVDARTVHRQSYEGMRLPQPASWDTATVQALLRKLQGQMGTLAIEKEREQKLRALDIEDVSLAKEQAELDIERQSVFQQLGVDLQLDAEWLPLFIENLSKWQQMVDALQLTVNDVAGVGNEIRGLLRQLAEGLAAYGYAAPENASVAGEYIDNLDLRIQARNRALDQVSDCNRRIQDEYEPAITQLADRKSAFLRSFGLQADQGEALDVLIGQLQEWRRLGNQVDAQRTLRDDNARFLRGRDDLIELDREALAARRETAIEQAGRRDELTQQIATIESDIEHAKQGHDLGDALVAEANALAVLESIRDGHVVAASGAALCDWLRSAAIERSRPEVFRRARELLLAFTHGSLVLEIEEEAEAPRFLARQGDEPARPVDQLSTGERMQLLMAVRLAFVEQDETQKLPLLLDEVLGTSDDARALAIIQAVKTIAESGRQVFYFTAQLDEVGKWKAQLEGGSGYRVIDLVEVRRMAKQAVPLPIAHTERVPVPVPEGMDYSAYGKRLAVPPLDPRVERLDDTHLWHLLDDPITLCRLLTLGITTWGQLRELIEHGGAGLVDGKEQALRRAQHVAQVIELAFEAWRVGRGKPVDRAVLQESGCVSDKFVDRLMSLCEGLHGDARSLIQRLKEGAVDRWRQNNTEGLADYLREHGYLDDQEPLAPPHLRARVLAAAAGSIRTGMLTDEHIDRILRAVGA